MIVTNIRRLREDVGVTLKRLEGRCAVATGAGRGIGLAIAERLVADGARVLLSDIDRSVADEATRLGQSHAICDVSDPAAIEALFKAADDLFGPLDILVNNAGVIGRAIKLPDLPLAEFERVMAINVT